MPAKTKVCESCGYAMRLERDDDWAWIYACTNRQCEREERAA